MLNQFAQFASDVNEVVGALREANHALASKCEALEKKASAAAQTRVVEKAVAVKFDEEKLLKAANAIYKLNGSPANIAPDKIVDCWKANPDTLASTILKMASDQMDSIAVSNEVGTLSKKSSAEDAFETTDADEAFRNKYNHK